MCSAILLILESEDCSEERGAQDGLAQDKQIQAAVLCVCTVQLS
jgi:hypothetical protein